MFKKDYSLPYTTLSQNRLIAPETQAVKPVPPLYGMKK